MIEKSDKSIHNICIAAIKRHTIKPFDFKWTRIYEDNKDFINSLDVSLSDKELVICSTVIDNDNFSILTTQRLITKEEGIVSSGEMNGAEGKGHGDFKGFVDKLFTFGSIQLSNGDTLKYFIETKRASMVMVYGVRTRLGMTNV